MRREILKQNDIGKRVKIFIDDEVKMLSQASFPSVEEYQSVIREVLPLDDAALERLFNSDASKFEQTLLTEAKELYAGRDVAFTKEIWRKVERDVYLQILDNLWMQHLENMDHLREGIHWISVGQQDPLVEYRRQGQRLFEEMQMNLRHDVLRALFHAQPVDMEQIDRPTETELTRAARRSVDNVNRINEDETEFEEKDFKTGKSDQQAKKLAGEQRKKSRKQERKRKTQARKRK